MTGRTDVSSIFVISAGSIVVGQASALLCFELQT